MGNSINVAKIIDDFSVKNSDGLVTVDGEIVMAGICAVHQTTVSSWKKANRIPAWHWPSLIHASKGRLNADILLKATTASAIS